jgi:hypothetical protein
LIAIYDDTSDWLLAGACWDLMADVGSHSLFDEITPAIKTIVDPIYAVQWGQILCSWGSLRVVPVVLETLHSLDGFDDAEDLVHGIAQLLEDDDEPALNEVPGKEFDRFIAAAEQRYHALTNKFGTDNLVVFKGEEFSVKRVAQITRSRLDRISFDTSLRRKFEANTGIGCTEFFSADGALQPIAAATILESFLDNRVSENFLPGRRYFFGHPVPD